MNLPNLSRAVILSLSGSFHQSRTSVHPAQAVVFQARRRRVSDYSECKPAGSDQCEEFADLCALDGCGVGSTPEGGYSCSCVTEVPGFRLRFRAR
jgi:hypothetical protein